MYTSAMTFMQTFGGEWTEEKLDCLRDYLLAYRKIFSRNPRAKYFRTCYVDAFAGTGERGEGNDEETEYRRGSALRALTISDPFDGYVFIEKSVDRMADLQRNVERDAGSRIDR